MNTKKARDWYFEYVLVLGVVHATWQESAQQETQPEIPGKSTDL